ncbi:MAG TPA: hypothetical protein VL424_21025, partial [Pararobbsia sp.]|nr:hypothetical protein [Pararobbsia sp.]
VVVCLFVALQFPMSVSQARQDKHHEEQHDNHHGDTARPPGWLVGHYTGSNKNSHKNDYTLIVESDGRASLTDRDRPKYNTWGYYTRAGDFAWADGKRSFITRTHQGVNLTLESGNHSLAIYVKDSGGSYDDHDNGHHDDHNNGHHDNDHDDHGEHHDDYH